jgi:N-alpha-acetyltransferase 50
MASTTSKAITLDDLTSQNIGLLKKLNSVLFPVPYSEKFYKESLNVGELAKLGNSPIVCQRAVRPRLRSSIT